MGRDKTIDRLRGLAMLWVLLVHVLYWGDFFDNGLVNQWKSFCLFEMPLFFFVTGAGNTFSKPERYLRFVSKRFRRILIPYWVFAIICAILSLIKYSFEREMGWFTLKVILCWLVPANRQLTSIPYLTQALWFVPVYLFVMLFVPVLKRIKRSKQSILFALLLLGVFVATSVLKLGWFQHTAFYTFWTYLGLFYPDIKAAVEQKHNRKYFLGVAVVAAAAICALALTGQSLDMQSNKFPPNVMFLAFSLMTMAVIVMAIPCLDGFFGLLEKNKVTGKLLELFSTRSLTVFLYQVFAFNLTIPLTNALIPGEGVLSAAVKSGFCLVTTIPVCAGLAVVFGGIEKLGNGSRK